MPFRQPSCGRRPRAGAVRSGSRKPLIAALAVLALAAPARAQIPKGPLTVELDTVASGLVAPVAVTHAGDGTGRLFIVDQTGVILVVDGGVLQATPFLDISDRLPALSSFYDERGLLGLAFHPDYGTNGRFYVRYSAPRDGDPSEPCADSTNFVPGCHEEILSEFTVSPGDPDRADPTSERILFRVDEPQFSHNAGDLAFGPDGDLYFTLGDGGGANDGLADVPPSHGPIGNGQNVETVLGSILRIDVDGQDTGLEYAIPPDNPFVGVAGADEIFAYGFRNPFRFSFDDGPGGDGRLYLADVGQNLFEEVDIVRKGGNFGWVIREGLHCFDPLNPTSPPATCDATGAAGEPLLDPIVEYEHSVGGISIIGGFVYRGTCSPALAGKYLFGDFGARFSAPSGRLYYLEDPANNDFTHREVRITASDLPLGLYLKGFGEDEDGEIYLCGSTELAPAGAGGVVQRIRAAGEPCRPVPVRLASFTARREGDGTARIAWEVLEAENHAGFHVYRRVPGGERIRLTEGLLKGRTRYEFTDREPPAGTVEYWLGELARTGELDWLGPVVLRSSAMPVVLAARPNPFAGSTRIAYTVSRPGPVRIEVFDLLGRSVATLVDEVRTAGDYVLSWDGRSGSGEEVPAGLYLIRLRTGEGVTARKVVRAP